MRAHQFTLALAATAALALPAAAQAALAPVGPNVVALWQGEGDASDPFHGHNGSLLGGAAFAPATSGQAFTFGGAQQAVDVPDAPDLYPTGSFTVAGWVRTSDATNRQTLIAHYECGLFCPTGQANSMFQLSVAAGKAEGYLRDTDGGGPDVDAGQRIGGTVNVADEADHHLALVRDSTAAEVRLFVDGVLDASASLNAGATAALQNLDGEVDDLYLGSFRRCLLPQPDPCDGTLVDQLTGLLDDVVYWERAVPASELAVIHAARPNGLTTDVTLPESTAGAPLSVAAGQQIQVTFTASDAQGAEPRVHDPSNVAQVDLYARAPGAAFAKFATVAGGGSGSMSYTPAAGPGVYDFVSVATDAAGNSEPLATTPDAQTMVVAAVTPPATTPPKPPPAKALDPVRVEQVVVGLPSTKRCVSRRAFTIRLRIPKGLVVRSAKVFVDGRAIAVRSGARLTAPVNLKGLPKGRYTVKVVLRLATKSLSSTRRYRTCAPKRR